MRKTLWVFVLILSISALFSQSIDWLYANRAGGSYGDAAEAVAIDNQGNIYVTGYFGETALFGDDSLTSYGDVDIFVGKIGLEGNWLWVRKAGSMLWDYGNDIAVDGNNNVFITGSYNDTATFGSYTITSDGSDNIFLAKLDSDGNWLWAENAGGSYWDSGEVLVTDDAGNCYLGGAFIDSANFGDISVNGSGGYIIDAFVAKIDMNGDWQWVTPALGEITTNGITICNSGNLYLTGNFEDSALFSVDSLSSEGADDIFAAKIDNSGNWQWAEKAGGSNNDYGNDITIDNAGNLYITGKFYGAVNFGSHSLPGIAYSDVFIAKMSADGNWQWAEQAGGSSIENGIGVSVDHDYNLYVTGYFNETTNFGPHSLTSSESEDVFVAKMDNDQNWQWAKKAGGDSYDKPSGIVMDAAGNVFISGYFADDINFGSDSFISYGWQDIFIAKLGADFQANFYVDVTAGDVPLEVTFTNNSIGNITNYLWNFGDGSTSTQENPTHTYQYVGNYTVTLTVEDSRMSDTFTRENYIQANGYPMIAANQSEGIDFGVVYLYGDEESILVIENTGTANLTISNLDFYEGSEVFYYNYEDMENPILPTEKDTICVNFQPYAAQTYTDTLIIFNNSTNQPELKVPLSGTGAGAKPIPPENVQIDIDGDAAIVSWDTVTETIYGTPINVDGYIVLTGNTAGDIDNYNFHAYTMEPVYNHAYVAQFSEKQFYKIVACIDYSMAQINYLKNLVNSHKKIDWKDLKVQLRKYR